MTGSRAISLARKMTSALRESEHQFRQAFATAPHGMALVAPDGEWLMVNEALCRIVGYDEDEMLKLTFQDITYPDDLESHVDFVRQMLAGEISTYQVEKRYVHKGGKIVPILLSAGLVRDEEGQPIHFISQILDLTETKEAQQQLWQAQKMEAVGQLTGGLAHDFNNLLAIILGNLQLLERHLKGDEKASRRAAAAADAARRGAELTHRLLAFSRRQVLEVKSVSPNELIYGMGELLSGTLGEKVELQIKPYNDDWVARIDPHQLETAILNLAVNARDAMPNGGHLTIEAKSVYLDKDYARHHSEVMPGEYIALSVSDTGNGIPADLVDRVFQPFFTTKDVDKGTGLGLSMVYGFAKQSGGHVDIYSEEGVGTTITLYLPRETTLPVESPATQISAEEIPRGTETVLVVEDNNAVLEVVVTMLTELGYKIYKAESGPAALLLLASHDIDVLLTDIVMPGGLSGAELADEARSRFPDLKIIYASGFAETAVRRRNDMHKGSAILKKPFTRLELAQAVRQTIDHDDHDAAGSQARHQVQADNYPARKTN
jgi:PAS domain S-box-containing protein